MEMEMGGMMMHMGPEIFGMDFGVLFMFVSGIFYLICAIALWKPLRKEKNELIGALFAFLVYQAVNMFFMGLEMKTMNIVYSNIAALAVFIGSAYMLKFPFSGLSAKVRRVIFLVVLIAALVTFAWFMQDMHRQHALMKFMLWYDIVTNGLIVGGSIIVFALKTAEKSKKRKAVAGGAGVMSCCIVSNAAMISGAMFTSAIFAFLAPILILVSIKARASNDSNSTSTPVGQAPTSGSSM